MDKFEALAETVDGAVLLCDGRGSITYASPAAASETGYPEQRLLEMTVDDLLSTGGEAGVREMVRREHDRVGRHGWVEATLLVADGTTRPVDVVASDRTGEGTRAVQIRDRTRRDRYLQFAREVNELIIRADDEQTLLEEMIAVVTDRRFGCTSIALLDERGAVAEIYGVMEDWCEMDWERAYTPEYVAEVLEAGDLLIEDVTEEPHRQHSVEKADHGALALALSHRGSEYGVLTMHLPAKGSALSEEERDLLRELSDNVSTGIHNLRTERELRDSKRQLAVLDRLLRHNMRNELGIVMSYAEVLGNALEGDQREHAESIEATAAGLLRTADKEREIVELVLEQPPVVAFDLVPVIQECVGECRRDHPDVDLTTSLPDTAEVVAIDGIHRAVEELLENAVQHNDRSTPSVEVRVTRSEQSVRLAVADDGPGIPEQESEVLSGDRDIDSLTHGSGLALWLVDWITERSDGELRFDERDPRGTVVTISLRAADERAR